MNTEKVKFSSFAVEQCIRVIWDDAPHSLLPVHPEQDQSLLEPIQGDIGFGPDADYYLLAVTEPSGQTSAIVEGFEGFYTIKAGSLGMGCMILTGTYGGVVWRVAGYEDGERLPVMLGEFEVKADAQAVCDALTEMLKPARVLVTVDDAGFVSEASDKPVNVAVVSIGDDDTREAEAFCESLLTPFDCDAEDEGLALVLYRPAEVNPSMLDHYWPQLPADFYPPVSA